MNPRGTRAVGRRRLFQPARISHPKCLSRNPSQRPAALDYLCYESGLRSCVVLPTWGWGIVISGGIGEAEGVLSKSFHLPIPVLYSRTMGTPLPARALQTPTRGGCRDLGVPLGIRGAAGRHVPSRGCAGANQPARGSAPGSIPSPSLKPSPKPTDETCLFP